MKVKELIIALQKMDGEYQVDNAFKIGDEIHLRFSLEKFEPPKDNTNKIYMVLHGMRIAPRHQCEEAARKITDALGHGA